MPGRIPESGGSKAPKLKVKTPSFTEKTDRPEEAVLSEMQEMITPNESSNVSFSNLERAQFYGGKERLDLQGTAVQRVRDLQEENDHLQREIAIKEKELSESEDTLATLAEIEHRKILIARNTGEVLKIYLRNEERMKRINFLEAKNVEIQEEMMQKQGRFISTKNLEEKTSLASEFFVLKAQFESNSDEIKHLSQQ